MEFVSMFMICLQK